MDKKLKIAAAIVLVVIHMSFVGAASPLVVRSPLFVDRSATTAVTAVADVASTPLAVQLGLPQVPAQLPSREDRVLAAIANSAYPVTPGDMLALTYIEGKATVSTVLQVQGDSRLTIPNFGSLDGRGKALVQFIKEIEALVTTYLPFSSPKVSLTSTGAFTVVVKGEVTSAGEFPAWGLSRLSSVIASATPYASSRDILITSADGKNATYDLYKALQEGDLSQNPLVKAGDVVTLRKAERIVTLEGLVVRPGMYQLSASETLGDLLQRYGKGILPGGNASAVVVQRSGSTTTTALQVFRQDASSGSAFALTHLDVVRVEPHEAPLSSVVVEGAVAVSEQQALSSIPASSGRLLYQFFPGETAASMVRSLAERFTVASDLSQAFIKRGTELIPFDAQAVLAGTASPTASAIQLKAGDTLVIPFSQMFVTVAGGVLKPGLYPYVPDKDASYYINLAGGFDRTKNRNGKYALVDKNGVKLDKAAIVTPESVVTAELNTFSAINGQEIATTVTIVGLVASIVSIVLNIIYIANNL